jgi:hypothetical protein
VDEIHQAVLGVIDLEDDMARTVAVLSTVSGEADRTLAHGENLRPLCGREIDTIVEIPSAGVDAWPE